MPKSPSRSPPKRGPVTSGRHAAEKFPRRNLRRGRQRTPALITAARWAGYASLAVRVSGPALALLQAGKLISPTNHAGVYFGAWSAGAVLVGDSFAGTSRAAAPAARCGVLLAAGANRCGAVLFAATHTMTDPARRRGARAFAGHGLAYSTQAIFFGGSRKPARRTFATGALEPKHNVGAAA